MGTTRATSFTCVISLNHENKTHRREVTEYATWPESSRIWIWTRVRPKTFLLTAVAKSNNKGSEAQELTSRIQAQSLRELKNIQQCFTVPLYLVFTEICKRESKP